MTPGIATSDRLAYIEGVRDSVEAFEIRLSMGGHPRTACEEARLWLADLVGWMLQDYADDPPPHPRINRTRLHRLPDGSKLIVRRDPDQEQADLPPRKADEGEADDFGGLDFI